MDSLDKLTIITDDGEEMATILFTFEANDKSYVVFEFDETHEVSAAVFVASKTKNEGDLLDIETEEEWAMIDKVYQQYLDDLEEDEDDEETA